MQHRFTHKTNVNNNDTLTWSGFYKKPLQEPPLSPSSTSSSVYATPNTSPCTSPISLNFTNNNKEVNYLVNKLESLNVNDNNFPINGLDENIADNMIENCLPVGLALNFVINDKPIVIPMSIEEPSVIAAVSGAAKTISSYKGFTAIAPERNMIIAQVALLDIPEDSMNLSIKKLLDNKIEIIKFANKFCENMVERGGGVLDIDVRRVPHVCDAMGANCASSVAEGVAPLLSEITGGRIGLRIVSNLNVERIVKASFSIPVSMLAYKDLSGEKVANQMIEAYEFAEIDEYRATTHNKGIMNGIDAVAIATGQDWRAIEAAAHVWACDNSRNNNNNKDADDNGNDYNYYRPLTSYWIEKNENGNGDDQKQQQLMFCGELEMPITVGTAGGVLKTNPVYSYNLGIMGYPNTKELSMIMACVGLAQNFAALRALSTEGIQRGHMSLHAKNLAIAAGCPTDTVSSISQRMIEQGRISLSAARELLELCTIEKGKNTEMSADNLDLLEKINYLKSLRAIRERSNKIYQKGETNNLDHFHVNLSNIQEVINVMASLIKRDYKNINDIPPHGRWRHFDVGGHSRIWTLINSWKDDCDTLEITRRILDLFVVSVLLDAGAGNTWSYKEIGSGEVYNRSEGLAIASLDMFKSGIFSSQENQPHQVNADKLINISVNDVSKSFQVNDNNLLAGLEGRSNLLVRLGHALKNHPEFFKLNDNLPPRPGNLLDYLLSNSIKQENDIVVKIDTLWSVIVDGFSDVWPPTRTSVAGISLGDVWPFDGLKKTSDAHVDDPTENLIPFHKLSQWLTYSLMEPITKIYGVKFEGVEHLTGLPEYRNGGLFVDTGVLTLKSIDMDRGLDYAKKFSKNDLEVVPMFEADDSLVVEWRAMTVILLDIVAQRIRDHLGLSEQQLSLAQVLEAGTWKAGRELAASLRPKTRGPPIAIKSDGTVF
nr:1824_t:CDS:10 [Entrophospora candida]